MGERDIIATGWEQRISAVIRNHPNLIIEFDRFGDEHFISGSKIFSSFANTSLFYMDVLHNTEELFCVLCINPLVEEEDKYHTKSKWEEELNNEET